MFEVGRTKYKWTYSQGLLRELDGDWIPCKCKLKDFLNGANGTVTEITGG